MTSRPGEALPAEASLAGVARVAGAVRELKASVRGEKREPLERKLRRWTRLRTPELPAALRTVRSYDASWPLLFEREEARIRAAAAAALGPGALAAVEHFGSTAIPGLSAKSTIDLLVAVRGTPATPDQIAVFAALGYREYGTSPCDHEVTWLWNVEQEGVAFIVHLCAADNPWIETALNFRDYLRAFPDEGAGYEALKLRLAAESGRSLLEYSLIKLRLFYEVSERADAWRAREAVGSSRTAAP